MKKNFEPCEITVILFGDDVITASGTANDVVLSEENDWNDFLG